MRNFFAQRTGGAATRAGTTFVELLPSSLARILPFVFSDEQTYVLVFTEYQVRFVQDGLDIGYAISTPYASAELSALQITQEEDVVTIVHPNHPPAELSRGGALSWTLSDIVFGPSIGVPQNLIFVPAGTAFFSPFRTLAVTALAANGEESYASVGVGVAIAGTLSWDAVADAIGYNIYAAESGSYGFIGTSIAPSFYAPQLTPDYANQPPALRILFAAAGDYPSAVGLYQQRLIFAGSLNQPQTVWMSRTSVRHNFTVSSPVQDDDAVTFTLSSRKVNTVRHIVDVTTLLLFASGAEWKVGGDAADIIRPTDINARVISQHGSSLLSPIQSGSRVLYAQARQAILRDLVKGDDITILASHLFQGYTVVDWAFAETPYALLYVVRSDGVLLVLTDLVDQNVQSWSHYDTDGLYENVCVVPEGTEDAVYVVVNRGGLRSLERFATRLVTDIVDCVYMDSTVTYDGRNVTPTTTMTMSGSTSWAYDELVTVTTTIPYFGTDSLGFQVVIVGPTDTIRVTLTSVSSDFVAMGFPDKTVPPDMPGVAFAEWSLARNVIDGLDHLTGDAVSILGDGAVVASPNNAEYPTTTVIDGAVAFDRCYSIVHVGLPYTSDLETLDIDTASGPSIKPYRQLIGKVTVELEQSRSLWFGISPPTGSNPLENLVEMKVRDDADEFGVIRLRTDSFDQSIPTTYNNNGRTFYRNVDPLPLTILAVIPQGLVPPTG